MSKDEYVELISQPQAVSGVRMFESDFLEEWTKTVRRCAEPRRARRRAGLTSARPPPLQSWTAALLTWLSMAALSLYAGVVSGASLWLLPAHLALGVVVWTAVRGGRVAALRARSRAAQVEYVIHRWLFHDPRLITASPVGIGVHFLAHGAHHLVPTDTERLLFPPLAAAVGSALLFPPFAAAFWLCGVTLADFCVMYAGGANSRARACPPASSRGALGCSHGRVCVLRPVPPGDALHDGRPGQVAGVVLWCVCRSRTRHPAAGADARARAQRRCAPTT